MDKFSDEIAKRFGVSPPTTEPEKFLSPNQIGKILNVTGEAVKHWIYSGQLVAVKLGNGYWKVKVADLERFIARRHAGPARRAFVEASDEVKQAIAKLGFEVVEASNLMDALLKLASSPMDLIVLDVTLTRIPALSLLESKKKRAVAKQAGVILIGRLSDMELERAQGLNIQAAVSGPEEVAGEVERIMNHA